MVRDELDIHVLIVRRKQLAEVIAKHNQGVSEKEEEIIRASSVEEADDEQQTSRSFQTSSGSNKRKKFHKQVGILNLTSSVFNPRQEASMSKF